MSHWERLMGVLLSSAQDSPVNTESSQWLRINGRDLVLDDGRAFYPIGTNQRYFYPKDADGVYLAQTIGVNFVRIEYPFWQNGESGEGRQDGQPGNMEPGHLVELDRVINLWTSVGLRIDLACHSICGRQGGGDDLQYCAVEFDGSPTTKWPHGRNFWTDLGSRARWGEFLVFIADRYKNNPLVSIIEPLNEPDPQAVSDAQVATLLWAASDAIHAANPNVLVMLGGNGGYNPTKIATVYSPTRPWQIYTFDWFDQPGNDPNNPTPIADRKASLLSRLTQPLALRNTKNVPVLPQQFGSHYGVDTTREILAYQLQTLVANRMPGFQWEYRAPTIGPVAGDSTYGWMWNRGDGIDTIRATDELLMQTATASYRALRGVSLN